MTAHTTHTHVIVDPSTQAPQVTINCTNWPTHELAMDPRGGRLLLAYDPEHRELYSWWGFGGGVPKPIFDGRHIQLAVLPSNIVREELITWLLKRDITPAVFLDEDRLDALCRDFESPAVGIPKYWPAADWLAGDPDSVLLSCIKHEGNLTAFAQHEVDTAAEGGVVLDLADTVEALLALLVARITKLREILAGEDPEDETYAEEREELTKLDAVYDASTEN